MPGDKSISHRALIFATCAMGKTNIHKLLESSDTIATIKCLQRLGVVIKKIKQQWTILGAGIDALQEPDNILECGNSGTTARLMAGLLASRKFPVLMNGDKSLRNRPMHILFQHLKQVGVSPIMRQKKFMPLTLTGIDTPLPINATLNSPSAQIKSALMLFALAARGNSTIIETQKSRNHSEIMLKNFGAKLNIEETNIGKIIKISGGYPLKTPGEITIPGDISSAAFFILAATICANAEIQLLNIGINPTRMGFIKTMNEMGADIKISNIKNSQNSEPVANIQIKSAQLTGIDIPADRAPSMIDEYPAIAIAAACASGKTTMRGLNELKIKESDRMQAISNGLKKCSVKCEVGNDFLVIHGNGKKELEKSHDDININAYNDHRIAMSFLTFGLTSKHKINVDSADAIATSFPDFQSRMQSIGANITP